MGRACKTYRPRPICSAHGTKNPLPLGMRSVKSGQDMDFTVFKAENIDIHHVFPKAYCVLKGYPKSKYNSIVNKTPISFTTNRKIGGAAPFEYLSKIEEKYGVSKNDLNKYIDSHWLNVIPSPYVMTSFQYSPNSFRRGCVR